MKFDGLKDSGVREDMDTGSRRDTQVGKSRPDLMNPLVMRRVGMHFANGCEKYGERNFELGQLSSRYRASLGRHLLDYDEGLKDEDHLAAVVWNAMCIIMNQEFVERGIYPPEIDDFSNYIDHEGFWKSVGERAMAFNDKLRKEEETESYGTELLPDVLDTPEDIPVQKPVPLYTEEDYDLIEVPELPVCFRDCAYEDCDQCPDEAECDTMSCQDCDFAFECSFDKESAHPCHMDEEVKEEPADGACSGCLSQSKTWAQWPCCECKRNSVDLLDEGPFDHDFYCTPQSIGLE